MPSRRGFLLGAALAGTASKRAFPWPMRRGTSGPWRSSARPSPMSDSMTNALSNDTKSYKSINLLI